MSSTLFRQIREISDFVRIRIAVYLVSLAVSGYLIFNEPSQDIIFVAFGAFLISCGSYGYNAITDKEEDKINRKAYGLSASRSGIRIIFLSFFAGLTVSGFLGTVPFSMSLAATLAALIYSRFRLKKHLFVKNLYTAATVPISFIFGAANLSEEAAAYYFSFFIFFLAGSIISDLRDYRGDRAAGIKTIPVHFGTESAKYAVYFLLSVAALSFINLNAIMFLPLIAALPIAFGFVAKNRYSHAHLSMGSPLVFLAIWLSL